MPLKLSLGLSKKLGLPAYSSIGASCHLECELDSAAAHAEAERFHEEARRLFNHCRQAVEAELARELSAAEPRLRSNAHAPNGHTPNGHAPNGHAPCGHAPCGLLSRDEPPEDLPGGESDLPEQTEPLAPWGLSQRQLAFIQDLAGQIQGLGIRRLPALVALQYDKNLTELTSVEASRLISLLRQVRSGSVSLQVLLEDGQSEH